MLKGENDGPCASYDQLSSVDDRRRRASAAVRPPPAPPLPLPRRARPPDGTESPVTCRV